MTRSDIQIILETAYAHELVESILKSYECAVREYKKGNWQYFGNEIGQFIEVARRMIEFQLDGKYTPLTEKLSIFSERLLLSLESHSVNIPETYRVIIPRILYAMYCLRNKRGMIHKSYIDPNKMDASILIADAKWILAEFFRMASTASFEETEVAIDTIMSREVSLIWDTGTTLRILDTKMSTHDKILCLLYVKDNQSEVLLRNSTEYKNSSKFREILKSLHKEKLIEYTTEKCTLSPLGIEYAEALLCK